MFEFCDVSLFCLGLYFMMVDIDDHHKIIELWNFIVRSVWGGPGLLDAAVFF